MGPGLSIYTFLTFIFEDCNKDPHRFAKKHGNFILSRVIGQARYTVKSDSGATQVRVPKGPSIKGLGPLSMLPKGRRSLVARGVFT